MSGVPSPPFYLRCVWCRYSLLVHARGAHGADPGSGVQAAELMSEHVERDHKTTWHEYLELSADIERRSWQAPSEPGS